MPKFMIRGTYSNEGLKGVLKDGGSARVDAVRKLAESVGGHLESFYFAFGEDDTYVVCDLPDNKAAAAVALAVGAAGGVSTKTTVLLTPEEIDQAANVKVDFRAPGR
ncbi:GYD domain-containing protein [Catellatospora tritici]|uniref:GYD domain-containing protein n=1 Tax=Catellatospora tritici TaxID=2851566 RepID=UPI001C2DB82A|nr:GYD domain-containing protein [Catellatospora tritici]MBV1850026.1 GYD domain-containing protein [Catellatospora tritici]